MVRRLQQCVTCQRRFIAKSSVEPLCSQCQNVHESSISVVLQNSASDPSISPSTGQQSSIPSNDCTCRSLPQQADSQVTEPRLPMETIDLLSQESGDDNDSRPDRTSNVNDDDGSSSDGDEEENLPLSELIFRRQSVEASNPTGSQNVERDTICLEDTHSDVEQTSVEPIIDVEGTSVIQGNNEDLKICNVCGSSLLHIPSWNGRLNHLKRCSQQHGVTAQQLQSEDILEEKKPVQTDIKCVPKKPKSITEILMAGAKRKAIHEKQKTEALANKKPQRGGWHRRKAPSGSCPDYKKIPGTDFVVDGFYYATPALTSNYFLTHFHSDHYGGLGKSWSAGIIYCSSITANLVQQQLYVQPQFVHVLPMNQTMTLETRSERKVKVTLIDANHCPGAVMFLFQVGEQTILHVGDFRWNRSEHLSPIHSLLQGRRLDQIFFDTTYCDPKYTLPMQQEAINAAVEFAISQVSEAKKRRQRLLLLFGAYTIGKERIYLAVAKALGMKVFVDARRYRILQALEWPQGQRSLITKRADETMLWVVPLGHINMKKLPSYSSAKIGGSEHRFDRVIGFRPTGWSLTRGKSKNKNDENSLLTICHRGPVTSCSVPYSEHSAFTELVDCLACLQPRIIVPTVNVSKRQEQINLLLAHLENR